MSCASLVKDNVICDAEIVSQSERRRQRAGVLKSSDNFDSSHRHVHSLILCSEIQIKTIWVVSCSSHQKRS